MKEEIAHGLTARGPTAFGASSAEAFEGTRAAAALVECVEDRRETRLAGVRVFEERHRGLQLQGIDAAEYRFRFRAEVAEHEIAGLPQPRAEYRMGEIGACLVNIPDRVAPGGLAAAETLDLGEDEPHPVRAL